MNNPSWRLISKISDIHDSETQGPSYGRSCFTKFLDNRDHPINNRLIFSLILITKRGTLKIVFFF